MFFEGVKLKSWYHGVQSPSAVKVAVHGGGDSGFLVHESPSANVVEDRVQALTNASIALLFYTFLFFTSFFRPVELILILIFAYL